MLNEKNRLDIFKAQTENVRVLEKTWTHINRSINFAYTNGDEFAAKIHTKLLAQVYCAYAESVFSKVLHTPHGLEIAEINQVKTIYKTNGITEAWKKCLKIALDKVIASKSNHKPNAAITINKLIDTYIYDPSLLRNKLAHGQWEIALNKDNTNVNLEITEKLRNITVVELYIYKEAFQSLFRIIEDIIESPNKTHFKDYWIHIEDFKKSQKKMEKWSLKKKIDRLKIKKTYHKYEKNNKN